LPPAKPQTSSYPGVALLRGGEPDPSLVSPGAIPSTIHCTRAEIPERGVGFTNSASRYATRAFYPSAHHRWGARVLPRH